MASQTETILKTGTGKSMQPQDSHRATANESLLRPPVDIFEDSKGITLQADMPGVSKERLNLRVEGNSLLIEGSIDLVQEQQVEPLYADVRSQRWRRTFSLSYELEAAKIEANLKDGVLTVHIPKRAELQPRRIEVTAS